MKIEYLHAKRRGKPIIPLLVDGSEIPTLLLATQVVHAHPELEPGIQQLLGAAPKPPTIPPPADVRNALELRYLDSLQLEHSVWQHLHTPYSDSEGSHAEIFSAAIRAGLDFVVVTDHNIWVEGIPPYQCSEDGRKKVLVITGEEVHVQALQPRAITCSCTTCAKNWPRSPPKNEGVALSLFPVRLGTCLDDDLYYVLLPRF